MNSKAKDTHVVVMGPYRGGATVDRALAVARALAVVVKKVVAFFYKFLSSLISKNFFLLTSLVESSSTSHPAYSSLVLSGP